MNQQPFRFQPQGPAHAYETFAVQRPRAPEFWRPATCEEVDCPAFLNGWITRVPRGNEELLYAIEHSGRPYVETTVIDSAEREFLFSAGTPCFMLSTHRRLARPDIPDLFVVHGGDWRGNPTGEHRVHQRPEDWVEDFAEHTDAVNDRIEKG